MDSSQDNYLTSYASIATLNEAHKIYLVQDIHSKKIYVKKILDIYNTKVYEALYQSPVMGTPRIIDYALADDQLLVIEEYISGQSLEERIAKGPLSFTDLTSYLLDLCHILERLHQASPAIIHRDIKPSNIMITPYNKAVLLDFNAAKQYCASAEKDTVLLGTKGYASPEQYGFGASSPLTDIYSFGILLKELLQSTPSYPQGIDSIAERCSQLNPKDRYSSIGELKKDLMNYLPKENTASRPSPSQTSSYHLPGYRTKTPWKIVLSSIVYLVTAFFCSSLEFDHITGSLLTIERILMFVMFFLMVLATFNYRNVQRYFPFHHSKNRLLSYLGIAFVDILIILVLCLLMSFLESNIFHVVS